MVNLISSQLQIISIEVEAVINTKPLAYVDDNLDNQIITPAHFFSVNIKTSTPVLIVKNDNKKVDANYFVEDMNTAEKSLKSWKKGQRHLE